MYFISCGGDDDDNDGVMNSSLEGVWYLKVEKWYDWKDGKAVMSNPYVKTHNNLTDNVWTFTKTGDSYTITEAKNGFVRDNWSPVGKNEFRNHGGTGRDRVVIMSVLENTMEVEFYDGYYGEGSDIGKTSEFGVLTFTR